MDPSEHLSEIIDCCLLFCSRRVIRLFSGTDPSGFDSNPSTAASMGNDIADVDVYFKRLYSKDNNPPPISVDEFLDIMTRCKDSPIQRERVRYSHSIDRSLACLIILFEDVFVNGIKNLFEEYKFYTNYPERELNLTAQLFGGLFERGLFQGQALVAAFRAIHEALKKPTVINLWTFAVTALDRCKARFV